LVDVILVKADSIINGPAIRDQKVIKSLSKKYSTFVLGWNRDGLKMPKEKIATYRAGFEFFNLRAASVSSSSLAYLPLFWIWVIAKLLWVQAKDCPRV
jgi:hypothetical protein